MSIKIITIKSNLDIDYIFKNGEKIKLPFFNIIKIKKSDVINGNAAFITGKKLGNAVWRNKAKRRLKNFYIDLYEDLSLNKYQVLFLAKKNILDKDYINEYKIIKAKYENNK